MEKGVGVVRWHCALQALVQEVRRRKARAAVPGAVRLRWRWLHANKYESSAFTRVVQGSVREKGEGSSVPGVCLVWRCSAAAVQV